MLNQIVKLNLAHQKTEKYERILHTKAIRRKNKVSDFLGENGYESMPLRGFEFIDDPIFLKTYLLYLYYRRIKKKFVRKATISFSEYEYFERNHPHRIKILEDVVKHLNKNANNYTVSLKTNKTKSTYKITFEVLTP